MTHQIERFGDGRRGRIFGRVPGKLELHVLLTEDGALHCVPMLRGVMGAQVTANILWDRRDRALVGRPLGVRRVDLLGAPPVFTSAGEELVASLCATLAEPSVPVAPAPR